MNDKSDYYFIWLLNIMPMSRLMNYLISSLEKVYLEKNRSMGKSENFRTCMVDVVLGNCNNNHKWIKILVKKYFGHKQIILLH